MRNPRRPWSGARRLAAVFGVAATLLAATMAGGPAVFAAPVVDAGAVRAFQVQPDGTVAEVEPAKLVTRAAVVPPFAVIFPGGMAKSRCEPRDMCVWTGDHFTGAGARMGGDYAWCEGWRWENTVFQDHTWSIWNRVTGGPSSIWDRFHDGTYRYTKYGLLQPGYEHDTRFSLIQDAWVFDPANNCTQLSLRLLLG
ncbi:peptidase inhibitor family I36 protein [Micromonospora sp. CPCC 205371]|nr:peptidase inhibitor family I36 protein [Micromonospora sp. CPCC 205371]